MTNLLGAAHCAVLELLHPEQGGPHGTGEPAFDTRKIIGVTESNPIEMEVRPQSALFSDV